MLRNVNQTISSSTWLLLLLLSSSSDASGVNAWSAREGLLPASSSCRPTVTRFSITATSAHGPQCVSTTHENDLYLWRRWRSSGEGDIGVCAIHFQEDETAFDDLSISTSICDAARHRALVGSGPHMPRVRALSRGTDRPTDGRMEERPCVRQSEERRDWLTAHLGSPPSPPQHKLRPGLTAVGRRPTWLTGSGSRRSIGSGWRGLRTGHRTSERVSRREGEKSNDEDDRSACLPGRVCLPACLAAERKRERESEERASERETDRWLRTTGAAVWRI